MPFLAQICSFKDQKISKPIFLAVNSSLKGTQNWPNFNKRGGWKSYSPPPRLLILQLLFSPASLAIREMRVGKIMQFLRQNKNWF